MADKKQEDAPAPAEPKMSAEEKKAADEAERAEKQRLLALRLQFGPIRDPE